MALASAGSRARRQNRCALSRSNASTTLAEKRHQGRPAASEAASAVSSQWLCHIDASVTVGLMADKTVMETIVVGRQGRVVIPAGVRRDMGIGEGDRLTVQRDGERLVLVPQVSEVAGIRGMFKHLGDGHVVDDLIADRRREAANEPGV